MGFQRTALPNGMTVLTEEMAEIRAASLGFWVAAGSRDEAPEIQGASHFLEHLLFKGTARRSAREIAEAFDEVGGEANAYSAKEYTCFYGRVLDDDLPMAIDVLSDMLTAPLLRHDDVDSERNVILEEIAMHEDSPEDLVHDVFIETLYGDHPLGREVMGTVPTVKAISDADLRTFHSNHYSPASIVVAAAGSVDHDRVVDAIGSAFPAAGGARVARTGAPPEPASRLRVVGRETEQAHIVIGGIGYPRDHPKRFAWGVLDNLLGGGMSSRLFQEIRENRGLAYAVYSYRNMFAETGSWAVYAGTTPANAHTVIDVIKQELDKMLTTGITADELERAKGHMRGGLVLGLEDSAARMSRLGKSELVHGEILDLDEILRRVEAITVEDVSEVAAELLAEQQRVLAVIGPFTVDDLPGWA